jgi:streptothricin hydrolase
VRWRMVTARRTALHLGLGVVLPHDAHATCDVPALPGIASTVPAAIVARVAEWALGDQLELPATSPDVLFTTAGP